MTSPLRRNRQITPRKALASILEALASGRACAAALVLAFAAQHAEAGDKLQWTSPGVAPKSAGNWSAKGSAKAAVKPKPHVAARAEWNTFTAPNVLQPDADAKPLSATADIFNPFVDGIGDGSRVIQASAHEPVGDAFDDPFGDGDAPKSTRRPRFVVQNPAADRIDEVPEIPALSRDEDSVEDMDIDTETDSLQQELARGGHNSLDDCPSPDDFKKIGEISIDITPPSPPQKDGVDLPQDCALGGGVFMPRMWACTTYTWKASGLCHKPLYFEDVHLERYGHSWGPFLQPVVSGAHFFASVPLLPYKMGMNPPWECEYALGYYRPGSCAPYVIDPIPFSLRGAAVQGLVTAGVIVGFP